jgi:hypothetical protein
MEKYVVTGYTPTFWANWGLSWLASLKESGTDAKVIIAYSGELPEAVHDALTVHEVILIPVASGAQERDVRFQTWTAIAYHASMHPGVYAFWDGDAFFQEDVSQIFELAETKMAVCQNFNPGMVAAPGHIWNLFLDFYKAADYISPGITSVDVLGAFALHFRKLVAVQDNTWNFTSIPTLKLGEKLTHRDVPVKVVHPAGHIKNLPEYRPFMFFSRNPVVMEKWNNLMTKKGVFRRRSFFKHVHHPV